MILYSVQERCSLARFESTLGLYLANQFSLKLIRLVVLLVLIMVVLINTGVFIVNSDVIVHTPMVVICLITTVLRGDTPVLNLIIASASLVETGRVRVFLKCVAFLLSLVVAQKLRGKLSQLSRSSTESKSIVTLLVGPESMDMFNDMARSRALAVAHVNAAFVRQDSLLCRLLMQV